jgi:hypothetical protein
MRERTTTVSSKSNTRYDPENLFRLSNNIHPPAATPGGRTKWDPVPDASRRDPRLAHGCIVALGHPDRCGIAVNAPLSGHQIRLALAAVPTADATPPSLESPLQFEAHVVNDVAYSLLSIPMFRLPAPFS